MTLTHVPFLRTILARPDDDAPRLVYADWLEEQGETERCEFIRVQCELAPVLEPHVCGFNHGAIACWVCRLRLREREQMDGLAFLRYVANALPWHRLDGSLYIEDYQFRRGFIDRISLSGPDCIEHLDSILQQQPVQEVELTSELPIGADSDAALLRYVTHRWPSVKTWRMPPTPYVTLPEFRRMFPDIEDDDATTRRYIQRAAAYYGEHHRNSPHAVAYDHVAAMVADRAYHMLRLRRDPSYQPFPTPVR